jgi:pre-mRNA-splicing factor 38B
MSRAALWRQEGNAQERERAAEEIFLEACDEGRRRAAAALPLWGDDKSFHFNPLLLRNTIQSSYFQKCCQNLRDWNAVVDEIYYQVKDLRVFQVGKQPGSAFCLLLRLLTLRMTQQQLDATLSHVDSPYIRAMGFLYLRYACPPEQISELIAPYLQDDEELTVQRAEQRDSKLITMGEFVRTLFQSLDYYGETTLPRFPIQIERDLNVQLLAADKIAKRAAQHFKNPSRMAVFQKLGSEVMALYGDEENSVTWYKAVVDRVVTRDDRTDAPLKYPRFVVTFTEYGNTETVTLGELDVVGGGASSGRERIGSGNRPGSDLYEEVRRRERDRVSGSNKGSWARRPPTAKESLSGRGHQSRHYDDRRGCGGRDRDAHHGSTNRRDEIQHHPTLPLVEAPPQGVRNDDESKPAVYSQKKRAPEDMAAIAEKKRKLMAKYG